MLGHIFEFRKFLRKYFCFAAFSYPVIFASDFLRFAEAIVSYKEEHFLDRELPPFYAQYMVAVTNNCEAFTDFARKLQVR